METIKAASIYQLVPLPRDSDQPLHIRVLTLFKGTFDEGLLVRLEPAQLRPESPPQFEALSYVWGSPENPSQVTATTGKHVYTLSITRNLEVALRHLRYSDKDRVLWIDAVCIDQANLLERSHQVANMATVYELAERVVVWLGPEADDSSLAIDTLRHLGSRVAVDWLSYTLAPAEGVGPDDLHWSDRSTFPYSERELSAIESLLKRTWFLRLWVVQEVRFANEEAVVVCGYSTMRWRTLLDVLLCFLLKNSRRLAMLDDNQRHWFLDSYLDVQHPVLTPQMSQLFHQANFLKCSDDRDRVYALTPLTGLSLNALGIVPDYTAATSEVYRNFVLRYIEFHGNLDIITILADDKRAESTPSWVPSFSSLTESNFLRPLMASGYLAADWSYLGADTLKVAGVHCATVAEAHPLSIPVIHMRSIQEEAQRICPPDVQNGTYITGCSSMEAFAATLVCYREVNYDPPSSTTWAPHEIATWMKGILGPLYKSEAEAKGGVRQFSSHVYNNARGRAFVTTKEGYYALAPKATKPGDVICVLLGLQNQVVLRPMDDGRYKVVGGCFVHGLGFGEAVYGRMPNDFKPVLKFSEKSKGYEWMFRDERTGILDMHDPRLMPLRCREGRYGNERVEIGRLIIEREELAKIGVTVVDFELV